MAAPRISLTSLRLETLTINALWRERCWERRTSRTQPEFLFFSLLGFNLVCKRRLTQSFGLRCFPSRRKGSVIVRPARVVNPVTGASWSTTRTPFSRNFRFDSPISSGRLHKTASCRNDCGRGANLGCRRSRQGSKRRAKPGKHRLSHSFRRHLPPSPVCDQNLRGLVLRLSRRRRRRPPPCPACRRRAAGSDDPPPAAASSSGRV